MPYATIATALLIEAHDDLRAPPWSSQRRLEEWLPTIGLRVPPPPSAYAAQLIPNGAGLASVLMVCMTRVPPDGATRRRLHAAIPGYLSGILGMPSSGTTLANPSEELADAHLHFGGAVSELDCLNALFRLGTPPGNAKADGELRGLVAALRALTRSVQDQDGSVTVESIIDVLTKPDESWMHAGPTSLGRSGVTIDAESLLQALRPTSEIRLPPELRDLALYLLCRFHQWFASPARSSLDEFVLRAEKMSSVVKLGFEGDHRARFDSAMAWAGEGLARMELRKSYGDSPATIPRKLKEHANAFLDAAREPGVPLVQMPLTFEKKRIESGQLQLRFQALQATAEAFAEVLNSGSADLYPFFASVDVVGAEHLEPNWLHVAALNRLSELVQPKGLTASAHAGEANLTPLSGLRAIHEFVEHVPSLERIGHGLALGSEHALGAIRASDYSPVPPLELVENLAWAASLGGLTLTSEESLLVLKLLQPLSSTSTPTVDDLCHWYQKRFEADVISDLRESLGSRSPGPNAEVSQQLFAKYLDGTLTIEAIDVEDVPAWRVLEERAYAALRSRVVSLLERRQVAVEICPSSNAALSALPLDQHPLIPHLDEFCWTVNSDDPTVFGFRVAEELSDFLIAAGREAERDSVRMEGVRRTASAVTDPPPSGLKFPYL